MTHLFYSAAWLFVGLLCMALTQIEPSIIWRGIFAGLTLFCGIACGVNSALLINEQAKD